MGGQGSGKGYKKRGAIPLYDELSEEALGILWHNLKEPELKYEARQMQLNEIGRSQLRILELAKKALTYCEMLPEERKLLMSLVESILSTKKTRTVILGLRLSREEVARVKAIAEAAGYKNVSKYIRARILVNQDGTE